MSQQTINTHIQKYTHTTVGVIISRNKECFHFTAPAQPSRVLRLTLHLTLKDLLTIRVCPDQEEEMARKDMGKISTL